MVVVVPSDYLVSHNKQQSTTVFVDLLLGLWLLWGCDNSMDLVKQEALFPIKTITPKLKPR